MAVVSYSNKDNDFTKTNVFAATSANTYSVSIPSGVYKPVFQNVQSPVTIGSLTFTSTRSVVSFTTTQTSLTFRNAVTSSITWTTRNAFTGTSAVLSAAFGNGVFVVGGNNGMVRSSTDGITWTSRSGAVAARAISVMAYGNGVFVIGAQDRIATSTDGITWTSRTPASGSDANCIAFGNGLFIIGHLAGATAAVITTSTDGITWTTRGPGFGATQNITVVVVGQAYGLPRYVAATNNGAIRSSTDLVTWGNETNPNAAPLFRAGIYQNGEFILADNIGALYVSTDGILWTTRSAGTGVTAIRALTYSNGTYFAVGGSAAVDGRVSTSTDGITWNPAVTVGAQMFLSAAAGSGVDDGIVVLGAESGGVYSANVLTSFGTQSLTLKHLANPIALGA